MARPIEVKRLLASGGGWASHLVSLLAEGWFERGLPPERLQELVTTQGRVDLEPLIQGYLDHFAPPDRFMTIEVTPEDCRCRLPNGMALADDAAPEVSPGVYTLALEPFHLDEAFIRAEEMLTRAKLMRVRAPYSLMNTLERRRKEITPHLRSHSPLIAAGAVLENGEGRSVRACYWSDRKSDWQFFNHRLGPDTRVRHQARFIRAYRVASSIEI